MEIRNILSRHFLRFSTPFKLLALEGGMLTYRNSLNRPIGLSKVGNPAAPWLWQLTCDRPWQNRRISEVGETHPRPPRPCTEFGWNRQSQWKQYKTYLPRFWPAYYKKFVSYLQRPVTFLCLDLQKFLFYTKCSPIITLQKSLSPLSCQSTL